MKKGLFYLSSDQHHTDVAFSTHIGTGEKSKNIIRRHPVRTLMAATALTGAAVFSQSHTSSGTREQVVAMYPEVTCDTNHIQTIEVNPGETFASAIVRKVNGVNWKNGLAAAEATSVQLNQKKRIDPYAAAVMMNSAVDSQTMSSFIAPQECIETANILTLDQLNDALPGISYFVGQRQQ